MNTHMISCSTDSPLSGQHFRLLWLTLGAVVVALFLTLVASPGTAQASNHCGQAVCVEVGGGASGGSSGGGSGGRGADTYQAVRYRTVADRGDGSMKANPSPSITVPCDNWAGSRQMTIGATCYINAGSVRSAAIARYPKIAAIRPSASQPNYVCPASGDRPKVGANFTYTWHAPLKREARQSRVFVFDKATDSIVMALTEWGTLYYKDIPGQYNYSSPQAYISYSMTGCINAAQTNNVKNCYWSLGLRSAQYSPTLNFANPSGFRNAVDVSGQTTIGTGFSRTAPNFTTANGPGNCSTDTWANAGLDPDKLGFYYLRIAYQTERYSGQTYSDARFGRGGTVSKWARGGARSVPSEVYAVHACSPSGNATAVYSTRGALQAAAGGSVDLLNAAACPQPQWECRPATNTLAGLDASLYSTPAGRNLPESTILRNGQNVPVRFAEVRVIDQGNGGNVDVTGGNTGPSVRNISAIHYRTLLVAGSTPYNQHANLNDDKQQFFQFRKGSSANATTEPFAGWSDQVSGGWRADANGNLDKGLSFNWASDGGGDFQVARQWRVTGEFRVPDGGSANLNIWGGGNGATAGSPSASGNQGFQWQQGTYECQDYEYRSNGTRYSAGLLTSTSNEVVVVRSANSTQP